MDRRIRVAVLFGGRSSEHTVSCLSAGNVLEALDPEKFEVVPLGITPDGTWVVGPQTPGELVAHGRELPSVSGDTAVSLTVDAARPGLITTVSDDGIGLGVLATVDVVFPLLHGAFGEDGTIQGLLEIAGLPYVGAGVLASAAAMDKEFTKKLLGASCLPIGKQVVLRPGTDDLTAAQREGLGLPAFVKPARGGSSVGITRITSWDDFDVAVRTARAHDPKVIVEAGVLGREVECGVLEFPDGSVRASVVAEITIPAGDSAGPAFYDFDTKYLDDVAGFAIPADLPDETAERIRELAIEAFRALDCQGLARVDFFVTEDGPVINEINTMPGFTSISLYNRMWNASGVDGTTLLTTLVETALARGTGLR